MVFPSGCGHGAPPSSVPASGPVSLPASHVRTSPSATLVAGVSATEMSTTEATGPTPYSAVVPLQYVLDEATLLARSSIWASSGSPANVMMTNLGDVMTGPPAFVTWGMGGCAAG